MKNKWSLFYIEILFFYLIYFPLNSLFNYTFLLNLKIMIILLLLIILISIVFIEKRKSSYIYGITISSLFIIFMVGEIIFILFLAKNNIGESGFGIIEILSIIPQLILHFIYLFSNCYQYKNIHQKNKRFDSSNSNTI